MKNCKGDEQPVNYENRFLLLTDKKKVANVERLRCVRNIFLENITIH